MCGICGVWGEIDREPVEAMVTAIRHRGPDDRGIYFAPGVALGSARLKVLDLTPTAHQPMSNSDGTMWIAYNGETFNFEEERTHLESMGHAFSSTSDTEVVLRLYEHYGDDFLLRLRGMFALAIYDRRRGPGRERLLLARDPLGIKPLLYAHVGAGLVFASEMKALLASGLVEKEIDPVSLRQLLTLGSVYQPRTMLRDVQMLLPAHRMIAEQGRIRIERYWSLAVDRRPELRTCPYEELVDEVATTLTESVRLHLVSDVPVGAFLSGGVDSSVLVALMARELGQRVKTFSVGFEAEGAHIDESHEAKRTACFLGTDHTHVIVTGKQVRDHIDHIAWSLDQPSVDGANSYFISLAARQAVTVAISGTGGDELFAGYPWFASMVLFDHRDRQEPGRALARRLFSAIARQRLLDPLLETPGNAWLKRIRDGSDFLTKYAAEYRIFDPETAGRLLSSQLRPLGRVGQSPYWDLAPIDELRGSSPIERVTGLCLRGYTGNQLLRDIDAVSMAHSLEVRVPYLDRVLVDTTLSLPGSAKLGDPERLTSPLGKTYRELGAKRILIDVGRPLLPADFDLQTKRGFSMPFDAWLAGPLKEVLLDALADNQTRKRGWLDVPEVGQIRDRFLGGQLSWAQPWLLMMSELWAQEVLDGACAPVVSGSEELARTEVICDER
jgi:asparagine synthase (glutamine-hydrolysing)